MEPKFFFIILFAFLNLDTLPQLNETLSEGLMFDHVQYLLNYSVAIISTHKIFLSKKQYCGSGSESLHIRTFWQREIPILNIRLVVNKVWKRLC
jgi:hypothetical protein